MRNALSALAVILLVTACNQKESASSVPMAVPDMAGENLKGPITQVETDAYLIDSTGKTGPLDEKNIEKFDSSGYSSSFMSMNGKDSIKFHNTYDHNAMGFTTGMETKGAKDEKKSSMTIESDSAGKYTSAKSYDSAGKMDVYYTDISTNKFGQVEGAKGYHPDSTLKMSFASDYDSIYYTGGVTKDSTGKVTYSSKYTLNDKRDPEKLEETVVTTDDKTKKDSTKNTVTTYTYDGWDSHGNWTQQTSVNEKGKPFKIVKRVITYTEEKKP